MPRHLGVMTETREITIEDVVHFLAALLQHGWGRCEIVIVAHRFESVRPTPVFKDGEHMSAFADLLTNHGSSV